MSAVGERSLVVAPKWLAEHLGDANVRVVDVRPPHQYLRGHVPGSVNLPAMFLSDPTGDPPSPDVLSRTLTGAGIDRGDTVIAVDDGISPAAARLVWVLHYYSHERAAVLDGGIPAWVADGRALSTERSAPERGYYAAPNPDREVIAHLDDVQRLQSGEAVVLDVRSAAEYHGLEAHAARAGHIPGAAHVDWVENLRRTPDGQVSWRPAEELLERYRHAGLDPELPVVVYCQTGGRAAATYVGLKHAGFRHVRMYARGWSEWGNRFDTEVEQ